MKRSNKRLKEKKKVLGDATSEALRQARSTESLARQLQVEESSVYLVAQASPDNVKIKAKEQAKDIDKWAASALNKEKVSHAKKVKKLKSGNDMQHQDHLFQHE